MVAVSLTAALRACVSPGKMRAFEEGRPVVEGVLNAVRQHSHAMT